MIFASGKEKLGLNSDVEVEIVTEDGTEVDEDIFGELPPSTIFMVGDLTLFEALTGGAFDRLNWQYSGEFDQNFSKKSNARGFARGGGGGWAVLELTGA